MMLEVPKMELSELKRTVLNIQSICEIMEKGITKDQIPLIRREMSKHMQDMDTRYLNLVKKLDDM